MHPFRRLGSGLVALVCATAVGALGFWWLGEGRWSLADCAYFTVITLSTVGFGETLPGLDATPWARGWTVMLLLFGSGSLIYFASSVTALFVEGDLGGALRRRRMLREIEGLTSHIVVCGSGATGMIVIRELQETGVPFVVVEREAERIEAAIRQIGRPFLYVHGDATEDEDLEAAGVARARGLIAVLTDDRDNVMVTITARALNERMRIVAKAIQLETHPKLRRAGANAVVSPNTIGGRRMVVEMVAPSSLQFLDDLAQDHAVPRGIEDVPVRGGDAMVGRAVGELEIGRRHDALLLAIRRPDGSYRHNPPGDLQLVAGDVLVVLGPPDAARALSREVSGGTSAQR